MVTKFSMTKNCFILVRLIRIRILHADLDIKKGVLDPNYWYDTVPARRYVLDRYVTCLTGRSSLDLPEEEKKRMRLEKGEQSINYFKTCLCTVTVPYIHTKFVSLVHSSDVKFKNLSVV